MLLLREWAGNFSAVILWALYSLIPSRPLRRTQDYTRPWDELLRRDYFIAGRDSGRCDLVSGEEPTVRATAQQCAWNVSPTSTY